MIAALALAAVGTIGQCDPPDGPRATWSRSAKAETRARVQAVCEHVRASEAVCEYLDVVVYRESFGGAAGVWHDQGRGLGAMGLMISAHRDKWPGNDEKPAFCQPEVSALVTLEILHRAARKWNAGSLGELDSVFSGRMRTFLLEDGSKLRTPGKPSSGICARLKRRGLRCHARLTAKDLGRRVPYRKRRGLAWALAARFTAMLDRDTKPDNSVVITGDVLDIATVFGTI